ncbi:MAG TPA: hypothetical protein VFR85_13150 [Anaeromyxobacteraceae bacterium]|nr:hypothetical protein [Anaeromyxobacteraceae bacterium]
MPRSARSVDDVIRTAVEGVVARASAAIARAVAELTAARLDEELRRSAGRAGGRGRRAGARGRRRGEITRWAADRRARRVPNFVIETTGLKTKKQVVAKFGEGVVFEKGKPAPKPK